MKKIINILAFLILSMVGISSCEVILSVDDVPIAITLDAVVSPDTAVVVNISQTFSINNSPSYKFLDYYDYYSHHDTVYDTLAVIENAQVFMKVNSDAPRELTYRPDKYRYESDYVPAEGDEISFDVSIPNYITILPVQASTKIPKAPQFEVESYQSIYAPIDRDITAISGAYEVHCKDTLVEIKLKLKDNPHEDNFYRIRVRSIGDNWQVDSITDDLGNLLRVDSTYSSYVRDVFSSSDVIFIDRNIPISFSGWPAYFSNFVDDALFRNGEYTATISTRLMHGENTRIVIDYYSITRDLYSYMKSIQQYRAHTDDVMSNPISIHTNIVNGYGILGAMNMTRHVVYPHLPQ